MIQWEEKRRKETRAITAQHPLEQRENQPERISMRGTNFEILSSVEVQVIVSSVCGCVSQLQIKDAAERQNKNAVALASTSSTSLVAGCSRA